MIKARTFAAAAVLATAPLMMGATTAFASTAGHHGTTGSLIDQTQTLAGEQATFIQGGDDLGRGAGELVSSAYIGGPQGILDIPAHVLGMPKQLLYIP
jgi:hypothetical protein